MTTRELLRRRVIELVHGLPYDDIAEIGMVCKECGSSALSMNNTERVCHRFYCRNCDNATGWKFNDISLSDIAKMKYFPITLSRVMQAMSNSKDILYTVGNKGVCRVTGLNNKHVYDPVFNWQLTTEDGATATDDDQTDEAIEKLYKLIK